MLDASDRLRVEDAIRVAERGTAGEIVVVVTRQAGSYGAVPLAAGLATALVLPWILIAATGLGPVRVALWQLAAALAVLALASPARLRLLLAPRAVRRAAAGAAAAREFASRGMAETRGRTGVLLFVAEAERYAEVVGDVAISGSVPDAAWRAVIDALLDAFGRRAYGDGLVAAVGAIGTILAEHAPPGSGDTDELPNRVVVL